MSSLDEIIELYARDVDVTMIDESLRLSVEERLRALQEFGRCQDELRTAMERRLTRIDDLLRALSTGNKVRPFFYLTVSSKSRDNTRASSATRIPVT
ncbi:MAG: hypothetical protein WBY44_17265 [Bryobacteraceae bacterium]|jgi:hypothetical protein